MTTPIILGPKEKWIERFSKTGLGKVVTSPKTTLALGATLGAIATGGALAPVATKTALKGGVSLAGKGAKALIPKSVKGAVKTLAGAGIVSGLGVSGIKKVGKTIFEKGKTGGEIVAGKKSIGDVLGVGAGDKILSKENLLKAVKTAGVIGAGALGVSAIKNLLEKKKESETLMPQTKALGFTDPQPVGLGGVPVVVSPQYTPSQAPQSTKQIQPLQNIIQIQVQ